MYTHFRLCIGFKDEFNCEFNEYKSREMIVNFIEIYFLDHCFQCFCCGVSLHHILNDL